MVIDLTAVERRLADFGLHWGVLLALETWRAALPLVAGADNHEDHGLDEAGIEQAIRLLGGGPRPFVLPDEYDWPTS
jgi:hypothetical protein